MEQDPTWKQVIPYPVLRDGDRWFLMRRTRSGGDARLHDRYSIGVGGHVNPEDGGLGGDLEIALRRERLGGGPARLLSAVPLVRRLHSRPTRGGRGPLRA